MGRKTLTQSISSISRSSRGNSSGGSSSWVADWL